MKQLLIEINKLIGETGVLRDEATLEHIVSNSKEIAKDIATKHPFVDGNKRTAYIVWYLYINSELKTIEMGLIHKAIKHNKDWLDILREC